MPKKNNHDAYIAAAPQPFRAMLGRLRAQLSRALPDAEEVMKTLIQHGISRSWAKQALEIAREQGRFTIFAMVDALTRMAGEMQFAGDRTEADRQAAGLLQLAA